MYDFFVVWKTNEDEYFVTKLQFASMHIATNLSMQSFVEMAFDVEYPNTSNDIVKGYSYECVTIFYSADTHFIY